MAALKSTDVSMPVYGSVHYVFVKQLWSIKFSQATAGNSHVLSLHNAGLKLLPSHNAHIRIVSTCSFDMQAKVVRLTVM